MPSADLGDVELWYDEVGDGRRCLVLHGGLGIDHRAYTPGLDPLGAALRLVYYDHRCHGASGEAPLDSLTLPQLADDADRLRAHLGDDRIGVLGHSFGGWIALELAARHRTRLAFLIIVSSSPTVDFGEELTASMDARLTPAMRDSLSRPAPRRSDAWLEQAGVLLPLYFHRWEPRFLDAVYGAVRPNVDAAMAGGRAVAGWDRWSSLPSIDVPTLFVVGERDFIPHRRPAARAAELMPDASIVVIEDSGHYPWLEQRTAFFDAVTGWLRQRGLAPT